jgi:hypothetical protein
LQQTRAAILNGAAAAAPCRPHRGPRDRATGHASSRPCRSSRSGTSCPRINATVRPVAGR